MRTSVIANNIPCLLLKRITRSVEAAVEQIDSAAVVPILSPLIRMYPFVDVQLWRDDASLVCWARKTFPTVLPEPPYVPAGIP